MKNISSEVIFLIILFIFSLILIYDSQHYMLRAVLYPLAVLFPLTALLIILIIIKSIKEHKAIELSKSVDKESQRRSLIAVMSILIFLIFSILLGLTIGLTLATLIYTRFIAKSSWRTTFISTLVVLLMAIAFSYFYPLYEGIILKKVFHVGE